MNDYKQARWDDALLLSDLGSPEAGSLGPESRGRLNTAKHGQILLRLQAYICLKWFHDIS